MEKTITVPISEWLETQELANRVRRGAKKSAETKRHRMDILGPKALDMWERGETYASVASRFGVSTQTAKRWVQYASERRNEINEDM